jgi:hypothetical protein
MEELKRLEEIYEPDERQKIFVSLDREKGVIKEMLLEDYHRMADSIKLHSGVPEVVRDQFETARNLIVYSWFYYPFNVTAQLQAITCVELALKIKANCRFVSKGRPPGLKELLKKAVNERWITDNGFAQVREIKIQDTSKIKFRKLNGEVVSSYCETVIEALPEIRNYLMHGERLLHSQGADWVDKCAEIINQLFEVVE